MGGSVTINWHNAMHYPLFIKFFGPLSGFSTSAFERNNGALSRVMHNGMPADLPPTIWSNVSPVDHPEADESLLGLSPRIRDLVIYYSDYQGACPSMVKTCEPDLGRLRLLHT